MFFFFFLMVRRPPRSTLSSSSAESDVYKRQGRPRTAASRLHKAADGSTAPSLSRRTATTATPGISGGGGARTAHRSREDETSIPGPRRTRTRGVLTRGPNGGTSARRRHGLSGLPRHRPRAASGANVTRRKHTLTGLTCHRPQAARGDNATKSPVPAGPRGGRSSGCKGPRTRACVSVTGGVECCRAATITTPAAPSATNATVPRRAPSGSSPPTHQPPCAPAGRRSCPTTRAHAADATSPSEGEAKGIGHPHPGGGRLCPRRSRPRTLRAVLPVRESHLTLPSKMPV